MAASTPRARVGLGLGRRGGGFLRGAWRPDWPIAVVARRFARRRFPRPRPPYGKGPGTAVGWGVPNCTTPRHSLAGKKRESPWPRSPATPRVRSASPEGDSPAPIRSRVSRVPITPPEGLAGSATRQPRGSSDWRPSSASAGLLGAHRGRGHDGEDGGTLGVCEPRPSGEERCQGGVGGDCTRFCTGNGANIVISRGKRDFFDSPTAY